MDSMIVWMSCGTDEKPCYVWPIVLGEALGHCRLCGLRPSKFADEPASGKAEDRRTW